MGNGDTGRHEHAKHVLGPQHPISEVYEPSQFASMDLCEREFVNGSRGIDQRIHSCMGGKEASVKIPCDIIAVPRRYGSTATIAINIDPGA